MIDDTSTREEVLEAVKQNGALLRSAHPDLKNDRDVVLTAVSNNPAALIHAHADLLQDKAFVLEAVKKNAGAFIFAPTVFKPFLDAFNELNESYNTMSDQNIKEAVGNILNQCEKMFIANQESMDNLTMVLKNTDDFLNPEIADDGETYQEFASRIAKNPSQGMQLVGKLMMNLAVIMLGASIVMATTGVGLLPAAGVLVSAVGIFSGGSALKERGEKDNTDLIKSMDELTNICSMPNF